MADAAAAALPPSGKTAADESFPVASLLLPPATRRAVMAFYRFARTADDVADSPRLSGEEKLNRLDALAVALEGRPAGPAAETAATLYAEVNGNPLLLGHALQLLHAFRRDAVSDHCHDWADLAAYCRYSAAPVGRFLLDLHGEDPTSFPAGDALCAAHQLLNHLQDCGTDFRTLGRVYIPRSWLLAEGLNHAVFAEPQTSPALRRVFDRLLDNVDGLLDLARPLPKLIRNRRLRLEASVTVAIAERLAQALRRGDPLARAVMLSPAGNLLAFAVGIVRALVPG